ncbi:hypothetical protein C453_17614 [Haloferax elongans ATCC BAA-1513]|uniref:Uncharacterized protein n=1 Tax=Haloferax elongans ATCC BAA-1513 TaxID=1230453 RepID=M0HDP8_HALEO|nr:hypothetical protein [Haloferax elongans]ELZ81857.1 hypothetical protein C453_17614 [Haloferax elongans ATCC BAA-1513]
MDDRPIDPMGRDTVEEYLEYVGRVPQEIRDRVDRDVHPLTGEKTSFRLNNHVLFAELYLLAEESETSPTPVDMTKFGAFHVSFYRDRFGTFACGVEFAGLEPNFHSPEERLRYDEYDVSEFYTQPRDD